MKLSSLALDSNPITGPRKAFVGVHYRSISPRRPTVVVCSSAKPVVASASLSVAESATAAQGLPNRIGSLSQVSGVLGSQWGDEGKGKLVDILAQHFDIVARCQVRSLLKTDVYACAHIYAFGMDSYNGCVNND